MKILRMIFSWFFLLVFFSACGLDTFYYLDPPISIDFIDESESLSNDPSKKFVSFATASSNADNADIFQGSSVYYKIYNSPDQLFNNKKSIENINKEYTNQGMELLISWGYQPLTTNKVDTVNLVSAGQTKAVTIRLANATQTNPGYAYPANITVDGQSIGVPVRSVENKTFSFSSTADSKSIYSLPEEGQEDVSFSTGAGTSTWYVALYAVSTGMSPSLTPLYSQVVYLGSLAIVPSN